MANVSVSEYGKFVSLQNVSASADPAEAPAGGVYLFASGTLGNAKLYLQNEGGSALDVANLSVDIDSFSALGGAGLHQTQDHFLFSDNGTEKKITFSNLQDAVFADVSGDATIAAGGALTIAAQAVENSMLADDAVGADELAANAVVEASIVDNAVTLAKMAGITRGSIILGDSSGDPSLLGKGSAAQFLQSDGTDPSYVTISGDATVAAGGALTIANDAVEQAMIADDAVGADQLASNAVVNASVDAAAAIAMTKIDTNVDLGGNITFGNQSNDTVTFSGHVSAQQMTASHARITNLDVVTLNSIAQTEQTLEIADKLIVASLSASSANSTGGGLKIGGGQEVAGHASLLWDHANSALDFNIGGTTEIRLADGVLRPETDNDVDLGASGAEFKDLYLDGSANIDMLKMPDVTSGKLLVADGTSYEEVALSGDATLASNGALTIANDAVEQAMIADDAVGADQLASNAVVNASVVDGAIKADKLDIDGSTDIGADLVDADLMVVDDGAGGTNRKSTLTRVKKYIYSAMSGDATASDAGALTIAAGAVHHSMLSDDIISGQGNLGGVGVDDADEFLFSDDGTVKALTGANLYGWVFGKVSGDATIAAGGALTIAAQAVENSMLADDAVGADELAADAVVNASVAAGAAIALNKIDGNVDMGGNFIIGNQSNDVCAFGGPIKIGGNSVFDSGDNSFLTADGSGNAQTPGNLTVGTDGGGKQFTVHGASANEFMRYIPGDNLLKFQNGSSATVLTLGGDATSEYALDVTNGSDNINKVRAAAFVTYSDESLKSDVASMSNTALDTVMSLEGVEFTWKDSGERDFGFIAQDVQSVLPNAVHTAADGVQGVDYSRLTSVLVEAVKAQQVQIEELKALLKK